MEEVDVLPVDGGRELRIVVEPRLLGPPVEAVAVSSVSLTEKRTTRPAVRTEPSLLVSVTRSGRTRSIGAPAANDAKRSTIRCVVVDAMMHTWPAAFGRVITRFGVTDPLIFCMPLSGGRVMSSAGGNR